MDACNECGFTYVLAAAPSAGPDIVAYVDAVGANARTADFGGFGGLIGGY